MRSREPRTLALACVFGLLSAPYLLPSAHAQTVYRCVQKGKPVSLQSTPCDAGATTTRSIGYTPERSPTANELAWQRYRVEQEMAQRSEAQRAAAASARTTTVITNNVSACEQAKADRDAWERRVGLSRTIDGMRAWQEHVYRACK